MFHPSLSFHFMQQLVYMNMSSRSRSRSRSLICFFCCFVLENVKQEDSSQANHSVYAIEEHPLVNGSTDSHVENEMNLEYGANESSLVEKTNEIVNKNGTVRSENTGSLNESPSVDVIAEHLPLNGLSENALTNGINGIISENGISDSSLINKNKRVVNAESIGCLNGNSLLDAIEDHPSTESA